MVTKKELLRSLQAAQEEIAAQAQALCELQNDMTQLKSLVLEQLVPQRDEARKSLEEAKGFLEGFNAIMGFNGFERNKENGK